MVATTSARLNYPSSWLDFIAIGIFLYWSYRDIFQSAFLMFFFLLFIFAVAWRPSDRAHSFGSSVPCGQFTTFCGRWNLPNWLLLRPHGPSTPCYHLLNQNSLPLQRLCQSRIDFQERARRILVPNSSPRRGNHLSSPLKLYGQQCNKCMQKALAQQLQAK